MIVPLILELFKRAVFLCVLVTEYRCILVKSFIPKCLIIFGANILTFERKCKFVETSVNNQELPN